MKKKRISNWYIQKLALNFYLPVALKTLVHTVKAQQKILISGSEFRFIGQFEFLYGYFFYL